MPELRAMARAPCLALAVACAACTTASQAPTARGPGGGLRLRYRLRFREFVPLDAGGPLTRQALSARLSAAALTGLDAQVGLDGRAPRVVAERWIRAQGLAGTGPGAP